MDPTGKANCVKATPPDQADAANLGEPLDVAPLAIAWPGEPVTCTPEWLLYHPAYSFGWKVYQYRRSTGAKYLTYKHDIYGTIRSQKKVVELLDKLMSEQNRKGKEKVDFPSNENPGASQSSNGKHAA